MWTPPAYSPLGLPRILHGTLARRSAVTELEARLAGWYGARRALATGSGTQALQLALGAALDERGGAGVLALPGYNCYDVASAAVWTGAPVVFYDIDPASLSPDPESLERAAHRADVLVVANLYGYPLDWAAIGRIADEEGVLVVEDAAQGVGAEWRGEPAGSHGDVSVLSFGRGKGWTGGGGGAVLARDGFAGELPGELPSTSSPRLRQTLVTLAVWLLARPALYGLPARIPSLALGETRYHPPVQPERMSAFSAELVLSGRERALEEAEVRRRNAARLREGLARAWPSDPPISVPVPVPQGRSGELRLPVLGPEGVEPDPPGGVYRGYPRPLPGVDAIRPAVEGEPDLPGSVRLSRTLLTLPVHSRSDPSSCLRRIAEIRGGSAS